jgi:hypothetical protein
MLSATLDLEDQPNVPFVLSLSNGQAGYTTQ